MILSHKKITLSIFSQNLQFYFLLTTFITFRAVRSSTVPVLVKNYIFTSSKSLKLILQRKLYESGSFRPILDFLFGPLIRRPLRLFIVKQSYSLYWCVAPCVKKNRLRANIVKKRKNSNLTNYREI